ncbi:MAG: hypothetical protein R3302_05805 [Sulfurimonadaceae bacterium]|nr:hypothetical protein [Sulfurimonadaceae bacterium]
MRTYLLPLAVSALLLLGGCSSKEVYEPEDTVGSWSTGKSLPGDISDVTFAGAQLEDGEVITREGIRPTVIPEGYRFLGSSDGRSIAATVDGRVLLIPEEGGAHVELELKKSIAGASVLGDTLAVLFADNDMALYSVSTKQLMMKEGGTSPSAVDNRIVNPYFFNDLVLFPSLDGKIVIIHADQKKRLRSIIVSSEEHFNNVIYFKIIGNTIVAATSSTIFSMADKEVREAYDIRDVAFDKEGIWLTTKQGEVVALTPSLQVKAKQKFPFAHFLGMIVTDEHVFVLEKEGYLLMLDKTLSSYKIYDADVEDGAVFAGEQAFYFGSETLPLSK